MKAKAFGSVLTVSTLATLLALDLTVTELAGSFVESDRPDMVELTLILTSVSVFMRPCAIKFA
jgi:hypothetical protein